MNLEIIVRTSALLLAGGAVAAVLRRAAPSTRHLVWHITIIAVVLAPYLIALAPTVPIVPALPGIPKAAFSTTVPEVPRAVSGEPGTQQNVAFGTAGTFGTTGTLGSIVALGSAAVGSWFVLCWLLSGVSVWRGSRPAPEAWVNEARMIAKRIGLRRDVAVRRMNRDASPHVAGLFRSAVMMPPSAAAWTAEARHAALVHELMHIKRGDRRTQMIAQLALAIYWFNPLVWRAAAQKQPARAECRSSELRRPGLSRCARPRRVRSGVSRSSRRCD